MKLSKAIVRTTVFFAAVTIATATEAMPQTGNEIRAIPPHYASMNIVTALEKFQGDREAFVKKLIVPYLNLEDVSRLVVGKKAIRSFLLENKELIRSDYERSAISNGAHSVEEYIEKLVSNEKVEMATLFFRELYGKNKKFPVAIFDGAFDGEGMVTLEDFVVSLQHFEIDRLKILRTGNFSGAGSTFHLERKKYQLIDNTASKIVFEVAAMDHLFSLINTGKCHVSSRWFFELYSNYIRYFRMLERLAEGKLEIVSDIGFPMLISRENDLMLARKLLSQIKTPP